MSRGFVFTTDALVSVLVATAALAVISQVQLPVDNSLALRGVAEGELNVADQEGLLRGLLVANASAANSTFSAFLFATLPNGTAGNFSLSVYSWSKNSQTHSLVFTAGNSTRANVGGTGAKARARRFFADPGGNRFGVIDLEVWRP
jgi:hypothetical protein